MKKVAIPVIIVLFGIMLAGITFIQAWWIKKSLALNEQAFDAAVYRSLEGVVSQNEKEENFALIKKESGYDSLINLMNKHRAAIPLLRRRVPVRGMSFTITSADIGDEIGTEISSAFQNLNQFSFDADDYDNTDEYINDTVKNLASAKKRNDSKNKLAEKEKRFLKREKYITSKSYNYASAGSNKGKKNTSVKLVVGENGKNVTIVTNGNDQATITEENSDDIANINARLRNIDTMIEEMVHLNTFNSISLKPSKIDSILSAQLNQNGLGGQKVNLALLNNDGAYLYKSTGFTDTADSYKINLYPNDVFGRNVMLMATFPGKLKHVRAGIWWVFILSILFTLAMLSLFIYSIRMLIKHKNLLVMKNDFISHMSHEFKTPLAGISIGADTLSEKAGKMTLEQIKKTAQSIKQQSTRLNKDVHSVLLSALIDEKPERSKEKFDLLQIINQVIDDFNLLTESKNAKIETDFHAREIILSGDKTLWRKAVSNLLDNALKFSKEHPLIRIKSATAANGVKLEFADNGIGINQEDLPFIFEKFYRSGYYNKSHIQGFGLGLSFVKKTVEMHKGTIAVTSSLGNGTTIYIELPLQYE